MMSTYAIGDIHGCFHSFMRLLERVEFDPESDRLWLCGDLVNRGPDSLRTLRWVVDHAHLLEVVLGNHDLHLLAVAAGVTDWLRPSDTFVEILNAPDADALLGWLQRQALVRVRDQYLMVHAALLPTWSAADAVALSAEVEAALQNNALGSAESRQFFESMYGNKPARWSDALRGPDRLRAIINAMCRLRVRTPDAAMAFDYSGTLADMPDHRSPWFALPDSGTPAPAWASHTVIFGHWSAIGVYRGESSGARVIGLDSGCVWGQKLSALRLEDDAIFQVDAE